MGPHHVGRSQSWSLRPGAAYPFLFYPVSCTSSFTLGPQRLEAWRCPISPLQPYPPSLPSWVLGSLFNLMTSPTPILYLIVLHVELLLFNLFPDFEPLLYHPSLPTLSPAPPHLENFQAQPFLVPILLWMATFGPGIGPLLSGQPQKHLSSLQALCGTEGCPELPDPTLSLAPHGRETPAPTLRALALGLGEGGRVCLPEAVASALWPLANPFCSSSGLSWCQGALATAPWHRALAGSPQSWSQKMLAA